MKSTSRTALCLLHSPTADVGRIGPILRSRGIELDCRRPPLGDPLPDDPARYALIVAFGGEQHAADPTLDGERAWLVRALDGPTPILGLCLGIEMLAYELGAPVAPRADGRVEIGYVEVMPTVAGQEFLPQPLHVYQWHQYECGLPDGAVPLIRGQEFPNQGFRLGQRAIALQFHPDADFNRLERWLGANGDMLTRLGAQAPDAQRLDRARYDGPLAVWCEYLVDRLLALRG